MPISRTLYLEAGRRRRDPRFAILSRAAVSALSGGTIAPIGEALERTGSTDDDLLFMARLQGVSGLLAALAEREPGLLAPAPVARLREDRRRGEARGQRFASELERLGESASRERLPFVPLKGAILATERYRDPSLRPVADLDLLATGNAFEAWGRLLEREGYVLDATSLKNRVYVRPGEREPSGFGEHAENPLPVELHDGIRERFLGRVVDVTVAYEGGLSDGTLAGVPARLPDDRALALHLFVHMAPGLVGRGARLLQLVDLTLVSFGADLAPRLVEALGEGAWGLAALAERAFPGSIPEGLHVALEAATPPARRRERWLGRPGLLTGESEREILLLKEIGLCESLAARLGRISHVVPERAVIQNLYGAKTAPAYLAALGRYYRDRFS